MKMELRPDTLRVSSTFPLGLLIAILLLAIPSTAIRAAEPAERFLDKLKAQKLFKLAIVYLDQAAAEGLLPDTIKRDLPLERLLLKQSGLDSIRSLKERAEAESAIENELRQFLDGNKSHPRRNEARIELANILFSRGQSALQKLQSGSNDPVDQKTARTAFQQAVVLFETTVNELRPILESMRGTRVAQSDTEKVAIRNRYQEEYRLSQIFWGESMRFLGEAFPKNSPEFKSWLEEAEKKFSEVIEKADKDLEFREKTLSLLHKGQVQVLLGKTQQAQDSFMRVADIDEPSLRTWRIQATSALIGILASKEQGKYEFAIDKGQSLFKTMQQDERMHSDGIILQLAIAKAQIAWSELPNPSNSDRSKIQQNKNAAKQLLQGLLRRPGPHQEAARQLLASLGTEVRDAQRKPIPSVKTFADAKREAELRIDEGEDASRALEVLRKRRESVSPNDQSAIDSQIGSIESDINQTRDEALQLLERAFQLFGKNDNRADWVQAKHKMAYLLIKRDKVWEGTAIADFLAHLNAGAEAGLNSGALALHGYQVLHAAGDDQRKANLLPVVESMAQFMAETWPTAEQSRSAINALLNLALSQKRWDDAQRFLDLLPPDDEKNGATRRNLGYNLWYQFQSSAGKKELGELTAEERQLRDRSESLLKAGWDVLTPKSVDSNAVLAACGLASLYLKSNRLAEAAAIIDSPIGPLAVVRREDSPVTDPRIKIDALRLQLQQMVAGLVSGNATVNVAQIEQIVREMRDIAAKADDGNKLLSVSLFGLSKEMKDQLDRATTKLMKGQIADGVQTLLSQLVSVSNDAVTLDWAGLQMYNLGKDLADEPTLKDQSKKLMSGAGLAFDKILKGNQTDAMYLASTNRKPELYRFLQAVTLRSNGEYEKAIEIFKTALTESNESNKDVAIQAEAARTLQEWSGGINADKLNKALAGAEPNPKDKSSRIIWGWATIQKQVASNPDPRFQAYFLEARYEIAKIKLQLAKLEPNRDARSKVLQEAATVISQTQFTSPALGGPDTLKKYDELLRQIQTELGIPVVGVKAAAPPAGINVPEKDK